MQIRANRAGGRLALLTAASVLALTAGLQGGARAEDLPNCPAYGRYNKSPHREKYVQPVPEFHFRHRSANPLIIDLDPVPSDTHRWESRTNFNQRIVAVNEGQISAAHGPGIMIDVNGFYPCQHKKGSIPNITSFTVPLIELRNQASVVVSSARTMARAAIELTSFGRRGDNGGSHVAATGGSGDLGARGAGITVENAGSITVAARANTAGSPQGCFADMPSDYRLNTPAAETGADAVRNSLCPAGILAISSGGDGGNGASGGVFGSAGSAAAGGNGGDISVRNSGDITITSDHGAGILAISRGGAGGDGGGAGPFSGGANGGYGGNGGVVRVENIGIITTNGIAAPAIAAVSEGGYGGNATGSGLFTPGMPGRGGRGMSGGSAVVVNRGELLTNLQSSPGILAQSIGGNGGAGGGGPGLFVAVGGSGGLGGNGNDVGVYSYALITTNAALSPGLHAQSIGGGGGRGGDVTALGAGASIAVGGSGGGGGEGGPIDIGLASGSHITTFGADSSGIMAQAVGGGGGSGGSATSAAVGPGGAVSVALGGKGGGGGVGGTITSHLDPGASVTTWSDHSYGVLLQSVGGGGGHGGRAFAFSAAGNPDGPALSASLALGGKGGKGGFGDRVQLTNNGTIQTAGERADAVLAQSIGGGGGSGGNAIAVTAAAASGPAIAVGAALGATGGDGGHGGVLDIENNGALFTFGHQAAGIVLQSVGGGGGNGGSATNGAISIGSKGMSATATLGGDGGVGGDGGWTGLLTTGTIRTLGHQAPGVIAQSVGGGGGRGGNALGITASGGKDAISASLTLGGTGGAGGDSAEAFVRQFGSILTVGDQSRGVIVQSIAGGGGDGGNVQSFTGSFAVGSEARGGRSVTLTATLGGDGGSGGLAGPATLINAGDIATIGENSAGVLVQSIAGGGGSGGNVTSLSAGLTRPSGDDAKAASEALNAAITLGGSGGNGGVAGAATYTGAAGSMVITHGDASDGVIVQSIGGGGGAGGHASSLSITSTDPVNDIQSSLEDWVKARTGLDLVPDADDDTPDGEAGAEPEDEDRALTMSLTLGGRGGAAGQGGAAQALLEMGAQIITHGAHSHGALVQSIGGGGGRGGGVNANSVSGSGNSSVTLGLGGAGGTGADGGAVDIRDTPPKDAAGQILPFDPDAGLIQTFGDGAHGVLAQSIGGGGGSAGSALGNSRRVDGSKDTITLSLGGEGGAAGHGGSVTITRDSFIGTAGDGAFGVLAQSIGGGGGEAHHAGSGGISSDHSVTLGGRGGSGGHGGTVSISGAAGVLTTGALSHGIVAQSIGGGGGASGATQFHTGSGNADQSLTLTAGRFGHASGSWGDGGTVAIQKSGTIVTRGDLSFGILAQSIGGGGGLISLADLANGSAGTLHAGRSNGGMVTISDAGSDPEARLNIATLGDGAHGIFAQSIGGGGGLLFLDTDQQAVSTLRDNGNGNGGNRAPAGNGGNVTVTSGGVITTDGANAAGIFAMSAGRGAVLTMTASGWSSTSDVSDNQSGKVSISQSGMIATRGDASHGILAMADNSAAGSIDITVDGTIAALGGKASAVRAINTSGARGPNGAHATKITIGPAGLIDLSANSNVAAAIDVSGGNGLSSIAIGGTIQTGSSTGLDLDRPAVRLDQGDVIVLAGGSVTGAVLGASPGGTVNLQVAGVMMGAVQGVGRYQLLTGGEHRIAVDFNSTRPELEIGLVLDFSGRFRPYVTDFAALHNPAGRRQTLLQSSAGLPAGAGVTQAIVTRFDTAVVAGGRTTPGTITLSGADVDFAGRGGGAASPEVLAAADDKTALWINGAPVAPKDDGLESLLLDAANAATTAELTRIMSPLDPTLHFDNQTAQANANAAQINTMHSCGLLAEGGAIAEGECNWAKLTGAVAGSRHDSKTWRDLGFAIGRQASIGEHWRLGVNVGYDSTSISGGGLLSEGHRFHFGGVVKYTEGPWLASFALSGSHGFSDASRSIVTSGGALVASSEQMGTALSARIRLAHQFRLAGFDVTPMIDLDGAAIRDHGYQETGAGSLNLSVQPHTAMLFDLHPSLRIGGEFKMADGSLLRPYAEAGLRMALNDGAMSARFADGFGGGAAISFVNQRPDFTATFGAGMRLNLPSGWEARLNYSGSINSETVSHSATVKVGLSF